MASSQDDWLSGVPGGAKGEEEGESGSGGKHVGSARVKYIKRKKWRNKDKRDRKEVKSAK